MATETRSTFFDWIFLIVGVIGLIAFPLRLFQSWQAGSLHFSWQKYNMTFFGFEAGFIYAGLILLSLIFLYVGLVGVRRGSVGRA